MLRIRLVKSVTMSRKKHKMPMTPQKIKRLSWLIKLERNLHNLERQSRIRQVMQKTRLVKSVTMSRKKHKMPMKPQKIKRLSWLIKLERNLHNLEKQSRIRQVMQKTRLMKSVMISK